MLLEYFAANQVMKNNEYFTDNTNANANAIGNAFTGMVTVIFIMYIVFLIIAFLLSVWAARLSWYANTLIGWGNIEKVIFAFFAFLTGIGYLLGYLVYKMDLVRYIKRSQDVAAASKSSIW
jgi:uncharacterized membrane protein